MRWASVCSAINSQHGCITPETLLVSPEFRKYIVLVMSRCPVIGRLCRPNLFSLLASPPPRADCATIPPLLANP